MLVAEALGQLRVRPRLEHVFGELVQQSARTPQARALLRRLREQALGKTPMIDDLSRHGIDHRVIHQLSWSTEQTLARAATNCRR